MSTLRKGDVIEVTTIDLYGSRVHNRYAIVLSNDVFFWKNVRKRKSERMPYYKVLVGMEQTYIYYVKEKWQLTSYPNSNFVPMQQK